MIDGSTFGRPRIWYPEVGSTMDAAAALAQRGAPHGALVETDFQHRGRGRQGRSWVAPARSALLTSWVLRAPAQHDAGVLSPLIALALMRALWRIDSTLPLSYKWPNDVFLAGRKLAGILLNARLSAGEIVVIAGIGVNIHRPASSPDDRAWLDDVYADASISGLRTELAVELGAMWQQFRTNHGLSDADRRVLEEHMRWRGDMVEVRMAAETTSGEMRGLAPDGSLIVETEGGSAKHLRAGEVVRGPRVGGETARKRDVYFPEQETGCRS